MNRMPQVPKYTLKAFTKRYSLLQKLNDLTLEYNNKVREKNISNARVQLDEVFQLECQDFMPTYQALMKHTQEELSFKISEIKRELADLSSTTDTIRSGREDIYAIYQEQKQLFDKKVKEQEKQYKNNIGGVA